MDAAAHDLAKKGEALIAEGDTDAGLPLILEALDLQPDEFHALEVLGILAVEDAASFSDELFARLRRAVERASSTENRRRASWHQVTNAAFHDRLELVQSIARAPEDLISGAPSQAAVGALLVELGECDEGRRLIAEAAEHDAPLAIFHLARLDRIAGGMGGAIARISDLPKRGLAGLVRDVGLALLALEENATPEAAAEAKSTAARAEIWEDPLGPHLASEVLFLKLRAALVEGKRHDAAWAGEQLGMPPHDHDPGVMLRARALLGPLHLLRG